MDKIVIKPLQEISLPGNVEEVNNDDINVKSFSSNIKQSKWKVVKENNQLKLPRHSQGDIKLSSIIEELQKFSLESELKNSDEESINDSHSWIQIARRQLAHYLVLPKFHYSIIVLVVIDLIVVLVDLVLAQLSSPCLTDQELIEYNTTLQRDTCLLPYSVALSRAELFLFYFSVVLLIIFVLEIFLSFFTFGFQHYKNVLYLLDSIIVFTSFVMEIYFHYGNIGRAGRAAAAIVVLRLWKIVRAIHAVVHSITLKNRIIIRKIQEAQTIIEQEKSTTEKMLEKQEIKVDYLTNLLKTLSKLPSQEHIDAYVDKTWQQRHKDK
ncbi:unnamed protein product [Adineta steineri]|uniref:Voltage-gated hydrogen channel 1 n=1 Tax=Adineta steineri TaxID=433720 RepID=A0A815JE97_9BILA|nr:unnamed protein product [Adineta steineri]CAF1381162.1 unnamed protein product [Adineta steineri]